MEISAKERNITGSKVKRIRQEGLIPGSIFSTKSSRANNDSLSISIDAIEFLKLYKDAGESTIVSVNVEGKGTKECLISEIQRHPVSLDITNVSLYEVDLTEKITANIPVDFINEDKNAAIKAGDAILITVLSEIEVECLPRDLPQHFEVDVSQMKEVGEVLAIEDVIKVDETKITILTDKTEVLVKLDYAVQAEIVEEEVSVDDVEVEDKTKAEDEEGENEKEPKENQPE